MSDLKTLEQNREALLLAEVGGLLHDMGKCADAFFLTDGMGFDANSCQGNPNVNPHKAVLSPTDLSSLSYWSSLSDNRGKCARNVEANHNTALWRTLHSLSIDVNRLSETIRINHLSVESTIKELILWGRPLIADRYTSFTNILNKSTRLVAYLGRAHGASHVEKEDSNQPSSCFLSSPFGFEGSIIGNHNDKLKKVLVGLQSYPDKYRQFHKTIENNFQLTVGDTRPPTNEVTLYDWSLSVASLYKSAIAGALLGYNPTPNVLRWRLLSVRFDGFDFFGKTNRIPDLLVRKGLLEKALDNVRDLLGVEYPLGTEIYRDENGSVFVVPGCEKGNCSLDLLTLKANGKTLKELIYDEIEKSIDKEIVPKIKIDIDPWWGQAPDRNPGNDELPPITDHLKLVSTFSDPIWVKQQWLELEDISEDICSVCGVRPQGPGQKAKDRKVCEVCEERREDRSKEWAQARNKTGEDKTPWRRTIWIDEVADKHGRIALIVGKFDLTEWLNGNLIETLLVVCDPKNSDPKKRFISKNPSFARIQRVWRTTQKFWKQIEEEDIPNIVQSDCKRVEIFVSFKNGEEPKGKYHAYDAEINGRRITLVWDSVTKTLLTSVNLSAWIDGGADKLCELLKVKPNTEIQLFEPGGYGQTREQVAIAVVKSVTELKDAPYTPSIPLLAQPSSFMMLVPAQYALKVAEAISYRYELEMGKVRNRLPLLLGAVFFDNRQPFFSALDAGRRMLDIELNAKEYRITCSCKKSDTNGDQPPDHLKHAHFKVWHELRLTNDKNESLHWRASTVMGDGHAPDNWYPYVNVLNDQRNQTPAGRKQFEHPKKSGQQWVHVSEVQVGDTVQFTPSRFTWLYLDTSARRFEALDEEHIHTLEELECITGLWERLEELAKNNNLTQSKLQAIVSLLAAKRKEWKDSPEQFKQLAETTLHVEKLDGVSLDDVVFRRLEKTFELYHHILKRKVKEKKSEGDRS